MIYGYLQSNLLCGGGATCSNFRLLFQISPSTITIVIKNAAWLARHTHPTPTPPSPFCFIMQAERLGSRVISVMAASMWCAFYKVRESIRMLFNGKRVYKNAFFFYNKLGVTSEYRATRTNFFVAGYAVRNEWSMRYKVSSIEGCFDREFIRLKPKVSSFGAKVSIQG